MLFKRLDAEDGENVMFSMEKIGANIMKCRKAVGMTQMELADKMGISFQAVSNWERGLSCPDIAKLTELSNVFDVSIDEILGNNRAVEIVTDIENDDIPDLELNEIKDVAPILKQKQVDDIVERSSHVDVKEIVSVAPFLSQDFIDTVAKKTYEKEGIAGIVGIAPFVSDNLLNTFAMQTLEKEGVSAIAPILPFIDRKIVEDYIVNKKIKSNL